MSFVTGQPCSRGCGNPASWWYGEAWTCDSCYKAEEFAPGHARTGDARHFLGACHDCDAYYMASMTLERVENYYHRGVLDQDEYEAFCHAWATSAAHSAGYDSWRKSPVIPEVVRLVAIMRGCLALRVPTQPEPFRVQPFLPSPLDIDR